MKDISISYFLNMKETNRFFFFSSIADDRIAESCKRFVVVGNDTKYSMMVELDN